MFYYIFFVHYMAFPGHAQSLEGCYHIVTGMVTYTGRRREGIQAGYKLVYINNLETLRIKA